MTSFCQFFFSGDRKPNCCGLPLRSITNNLIDNFYFLFSQPIFHLPKWNLVSSVPGWDAVTRVHRLWWALVAVHSGAGITNTVWPSVLALHHSSKWWSPHRFCSTAWITIEIVSIPALAGCQQGQIVYVWSLRPVHVCVASFASISWLTNSFSLCSTPHKRQIPLNVRLACSGWPLRPIKFCFACHLHGHIAKSIELKPIYFLWSKDAPNNKKSDLVRPPTVWFGLCVNTI